MKHFSFLHFFFAALPLCLLFGGGCKKSDSVGPVNSIQTGCRVSLFRTYNTSTQYYSGYAVDYNSFNLPKRISEIVSSSGVPSPDSYDLYFYDSNKKPTRVDHYIAGVLKSSQFFVFSGNKVLQSIFSIPDGEGHTQTTTYAYDRQGRLRYTRNDVGDSTAYLNYNQNRPGEVIAYSNNLLRSHEKMIYDSYGNLLQDSTALIDDISHTVKAFILFHSYTYQTDVPAMYVPDLNTLLFPNDVNKAQTVSETDYYALPTTASQQIKTVPGSRFIFSGFTYNAAGYATGYNAVEKLFNRADSYTAHIEYQCN